MAGALARSRIPATAARPLAGARPASCRTEKQDVLRQCCSAYGGLACSSWGNGLLRVFANADPSHSPKNSSMI